MKIKVCGMRDARNIRDVEALGIDWMGFIFWPESKRYCDRVPDYLPTSCQRVGVFVNAETDDIVRHVLDYDLQVVQLHGDEDRLSVMQLRQALGAAGHICTVVKAVRLKNETDLQRCEPLVGFVDYFLFDTPVAGFGGSGKQFDWSLLDHYRCMTPFFLSGGIGPDSLQALKQFNHPCFEGIDLNSRFETAPGLKDVDKLKSFLTALRAEK